MSSIEMDKEQMFSLDYMYLRYLAVTAYYMEVAAVRTALRTF